VPHTLFPSHVLEQLPPMPEAPKGYDCCGGGCADCELRLYGLALKAWKAQGKALLAESSEERQPDQP
jgi:hypothetical protein